MGTGLAWQPGSGSDHEDAQPNQDQAGGHSTDEDLERDHHLRRLPAGSYLVPCEPREIEPSCLSSQFLQFDFISWPNQPSYGGGQVKGTEKIQRAEDRRSWGF